LAALHAQVLHNSRRHLTLLGCAVPAGGGHSIVCGAEQQARMGHKRVLLLAHGKKAETPEFKEAYAWLEQDGHHIDLMKTGSPEDMPKGVKKLIAHFDGKQFKFALTASYNMQLMHLNVDRHRNVCCCDCSLCTHTAWIM